MSPKSKSDPVEIFPQRCYACGKELRVGDPAIASIDMPLAFCVACRGEKAKPGGELRPAVVRDGAPEE